MSEYKEIFTSTEAGLQYEEPYTQPVSTKAVSLSVVKVSETTGKISMTLGVAPTTSTGINVLLDKVTVALLTTLTESAFNPGMGTYVTTARVQNKDDSLSLFAKITTCLSILQTSITIAQAGQVLDATQRLLELKLSDIYVDPIDPTAVLVEVLVVTEANQEYILTV